MNRLILLWGVLIALAATAAPPVVSPLDRILSAWERAAADKQLPKGNAESVSQVIRESLGGVPLTLAEGEANSLQSSFAAMIEVQRHRMTTADEIRGTGHWAAFCVLEASRRAGAVERIDAEKLERAQVAFVDTVIARLGRNLRRGIPEHQQQALHRDIETALTAIRSRLVNALGELRCDPLFPAFKVPFTGRQEEVLLGKLDNPAGYPTYQVPKIMMQKPEELYRERLTSFVRYTPRSVLFDAAMCQIEPLVLGDPILGRMLVSSRSTAARWPVSVVLTRPPATRSSSEQAATRPGSGR
jgi:hypothetical protein